MTRHQYGVTVEPEDGDYAALIRTVWNWSAMGLLVVRPRLGLSAPGDRILHELGPYVLDRRDAASWPGTVLLDGQANVITFRRSPAVLEILLKATDRLYAWQQPSLPEDLCLIRDDGEPALVSIAHELDSYLVLEEGELETLRHDVPSLAGRLLKEGPFSNL